MVQLFIFLLFAASPAAPAPPSTETETRACQELAEFLKVIGQRPTSGSAVVTMADGKRVLCSGLNDSI